MYFKFLLLLLSSIWLVSKRGFLKRVNGSVSSLFAVTSEHSHRIWKVRPQRQAEVPGLLDEFPLSLLETPCPQVLPIQARSRLFLVWPQIISLDLRALCNNFRKKKLDLSLFGSAEELRTPLCVSPNRRLSDFPSLQAHQGSSLIKGIYATQIWLSMTCKKLLFVQFAQPLLILQSNVFVHQGLVLLLRWIYYYNEHKLPAGVHESAQNRAIDIQHIYLLSFLLFICLTTGPDPHVGRLSASLNRHSENLEATSSKHINELHSLSTFHLLCRPCLSPPRTPVPV
jgi:hypothetical protein